MTALTAVSGAAKLNNQIRQEVALKLGFEVSVDTLPVKSIGVQKSSEAIRNFAVVMSSEAKAAIILSIFIKPKNELYFYSINSEGILKSAVVETKKDGKFEVRNIAVKEAQAGYDLELKFWLQYYEDNLKPKAAPSRDS